MPLQVDVFLASGAVVRFGQADDGAARALLQNLQAPRLFAQRTLVIGSGTELSLWNPATLARIDLIPSESLRPAFPTHAGPLFAYRSEGDVARAMQMGRPPELRAAMELAGGHRLFVARFPQPGQPTDSFVTLHRLFEQATLALPLAEGGVALVNPQHLERIVTRPGLPAPPPQSWRLEPAGNAQ